MQSVVDRVQPLKSARSLVSAWSVVSRNFACRAIAALLKGEALCRGGALVFLPRPDRRAPRPACLDYRGALVFLPRPDRRAPRAPCPSRISSGRRRSPTEAQRWHGIPYCIATKTACSQRAREAAAATRVKPNATILSGFVHEIRHHAVPSTTSPTAGSAELREGGVADEAFCAQMSSDISGLGLAGVGLGFAECEPYIVKEPFCVQMSSDILGSEWAGLFTRAAAASWCSHTQPRRSFVCFWCCAKRDGWPENNSFDFPGNFKNLYSCRLSAVCGAEYHWACMNVPGGLRSDPVLVASQTLGTSWSDLSQPRRPVVCSWCLAKRSGGPENNSFGFPGKLKTLLSGKTLHSCRLSAGCGAEYQSQQGRRQGAAWRERSSFSRQAMMPRYGPPYCIGVPSVWPSATAMSAP